jgi:hypothetical protein
MSKSVLLAKADAEFNRLFGEHNHIPYPRTSLDTCQGHLGGAAYVDPVVYPCCCLHEAQSSREGFASVARNPVEASKNV